EIAPISFQDSNGDGKGDLPGLIDRLDHLEWLGVDAVWLTPDLPLTDVGPRLRHRRLLRDRPAVRNHGGFRPARG
ncbi:MAG TPA: alpha-amylase family glycosyl hydrolase, partial [Nitrospiraceae bacterium]|nr:alpha-amylase family glycosyl hydrolase [Nitrospiraceae bacterium]